MCKQLNFPDRNPDYGKERKIITYCEDINDTTVKLLIKCKDDKIATIDKKDYDIVKYYHCYVNHHGYVVLKIDNKILRIHRVLLSVTDPNIFVDHIDNNRLNNTRINLRLSNLNKNPRNRKKIEGVTSNYIGVSYEKTSKKWDLIINHNNKKIFRKRYADEETCARARELYIIKHLKDEHYKLNFEWSDNDIVFWTNKINTLN